jgi:hypothetical protein
MTHTHNLRALLAPLGFAAVMGVSVLGQEPPPPPEPAPPPQRAARRAGPNRDGAFMENAVKPMMERLRQENPDEFERLQELHQTDRQQFFTELREMLKQRQAGKTGRSRAPSAEEVHCQELAKLYHQTQDQAEKERIRTELESAVQEAFEVRLENSRERLERLEKQIETFKKHIEKLEQNREKIVETRIDELTRPPELNWNAKW